MTRSWIKICGITRIEDAISAESRGASAVGFVFYPGSRRYIAPETARRISDSLRPETERIGVFVDESRETILTIFEQAGLTAVQLHGSEPPEMIRELAGIQVIKAFSVGAGFTPERLSEYPAYACLLDTFVEGRYGGTGKPFDWIVARECAGFGRIILAGGINPGNAAEALRIARPWGLDVSSGVESSPGKKDEGKMAALFRAVSEELIA